MVADPLGGRGTALGLTNPGGTLNSGFMTPGVGASGPISGGQAFNPLGGFQSASPIFNAPPNTSGSSSTSSSQSGPVLLPGNVDAYNRQVQESEARYQNMLNAYTSGINNAGSAANAVAGGYRNVLSGVRNTLGLGGGGWGVAAPAARDIQAGTASTIGQTQQGLIGSGLGGTSVLGNLTNQAQYLGNQALAGLGSSLAQTYAGYQSQLGSAAQQALMQGAQMQASLFGQEGGSITGYRQPSIPQLYGQASDSTSLARSASFNPPGYGGGGGGFAGFGQGAGGMGYGGTSPGRGSYTPDPAGIYGSGGGGGGGGGFGMQQVPYGGGDPGGTYGNPGTGDPNDPFGTSTGVASNIGDISPADVFEYGGDSGGE